MKNNHDWFEWISSIAENTNISDEELLVELEELVIALRNYVRINQDGDPVFKIPDESMEILISDFKINDSGIDFNLNTLLPHRNITSNAYIRDIVFELIYKHRWEAKFLCEEKLIIMSTECCKPTKWGYINRDTDNSDRKGITDGICSGLGIDDSGESVANLANADYLKDGEAPHTHVKVCKFKDLINE